tara:strand:- start:18 stop:131 length:114 start_codon:yes stop_codon:yes gene_type:complete
MSHESLTAAVMPGYHILASIRKQLAAKLGKARLADAA